MFSSSLPPALFRVALCVVLLAVGAVAAHASTPRHPDQVALRWGDSYFSSPSELAAWLSARGASYDVWAERHPAAAELLEWAAAERARRGVPQGAPFTGVPERTPGVAPAEPTLPATAGRSLPLWAVGGIVGALVLVAFGTNAALRRSGRRGLEPVELAVSGAGLAVGIFLVVLIATAGL